MKSSRNFVLASDATVSGGCVRTVALFLIVLCACYTAAQVNVLTQRADVARDGQYSNETYLTPSNVNPTLFGDLFSYAVDGYVSAQPLYMSGINIGGVTRNVVYVVTEHDSAYAFDADNPGSGAPLWQVSFINPAQGITTVPISVQGCPNISVLNEIGIMSTPVIDPSTGTIYVVVKTQEVSGSNTNYFFRLHALDITTGAEKFGGPVVITASIAGLTLDTLHDFQRPALLLSNGNLFIAFGSNGCDRNAHGWLLAYNATSLQQLAVFNSVPEQSYGGSFWMSSGGPAVDSSGNIYIVTANGDFDANTGGSDYGDTILKLSLGTSSFTVVDYFTPFDQLTMKQGDLDLGSGGVMLLPDQPVNPHLLIVAGKTGSIYLVNRDGPMGEYNSTQNQNLQTITKAILAEYGTPVYWNSNIYFAAHNDYVKAFTMSNGLLSTTPTAKSAIKYVVFGVPVISSNGNTNGILWLVHNSPSGPVAMSAFNGTGLSELYNTNNNGSRDGLGTPPHFISPVIANGKVYVGTETGLKVYGLLPVLTTTGGNNQSGTVATVLPLSLTVQANDPYSGKALSGLPVTFSDGGKGGAFNPNPATTNSGGVATTSYTLPQTAGTVTITAAGTNSTTASFAEFATAGAPAVLSVISGGYQSGPEGTTLPQPLVVRLKDAFGNAVPSIQVSFSDNGAKGSFSSNPVVTDSNGVASVSYTLPNRILSITITASYGSLNGIFHEKSTQ